MKPNWKPSDISVVIVTCRREPSYLGQTLASFHLGDVRAREFREITVSVDAADLQCVEELAHHGRIRWVVRDAEANARIAAFHLHRRACDHYWRALGLATPGSRGVLVLEDDVIFRDGWVGMLLECLDEMQSDGLSDFLLTAYSARDHEETPLRRGRCYSSYPASGFYGAQAMLYPAAQLQPVREVIWNHGVVVAEEPYDLLLKMREVQAQGFYTTRHSLVQHVGAKSTGLGDGRHRSPSFTRPWPQAAVCLPGTKPEFGVVMTIVERPEQVEWAIQRLRRNHAEAPFTLISDGRHEDRYAQIAEAYGGKYVRGEKLKTPEHGAKWWQRTLEAGLAFGTPYFLKMDPDASFNRPIARWSDFDCFGTVTCRGSDREHIQGGVQGFRRAAAEKIVASGICLRPEFREVEYWAWDPAAIPGWKKARYLSTDMTLRRILIDMGIRWGDWSEVKSWFNATPRDWANYAVSHSHKWQKLEASGHADAAPPLVSALMNTRNNPERAAMIPLALAAFAAQTYPARELVVVNHGGAPLRSPDPRVREILVPKECRLTLGELRNIGLAACSGEWVLIWDDDDWHGPERIAEQMKHAQRDTAVILQYQIRYSLLRRTGFVYRDRGGIHSTYLHHRDVAWKYPRLARGSDTEFLRQFRKRIALENDPGLFVRFAHATNIWNEKHIMREYAGREDVLDVPPNLAALLREKVLPLWQGTALDSGGGAQARSAE